MKIRKRTKRYQRDVLDMVRDLGPMPRDPTADPRDPFAQCFWCLAFFGAANPSEVCYFGRYSICHRCVESAR